MSQVRMKARSSLGLAKQIERIRSGYSLKDLEEAAKRIGIPVNMIRDTVGFIPACSPVAFGPERH